MKKILRQIGSVIREWKKSHTRSSGWRKARKSFLKDHTECAACGSHTLLQVHHKKPFHLHPELELDPNNLIALCMSENECHLDIGHGKNFRSYNPNVEADALEFKTHILTFERDAVEARARKNRLKE